MAKYRSVLISKKWIDPLRVVRKKRTFFLLAQLAVLAFSHPGKAIKFLSFQQIKDLKKALRNEHPLKILSNFKRKLYGDEAFAQFSDNQLSGNVVLTTGEAGQSSESLEKEHIAFHIDVMRYSRISGELVIGGWATDPSGIQDIEIFSGKKFLGNCQAGSPREDVGGLYPHHQESQNSGFNYMSVHELPDSEIIVKITNNANEWRWEAFTPVYSLDDLSANQQYELFLKQRTLSESAVNSTREKASGLCYRPLISVITPVYNTPPEILDACIQSVLDQYYGDWQLCLYDDHSSNEATLSRLKYWENVDSRIVVKYGTQNVHISAASNKAIEMAEGEFVALLDHDDELAPEALFRVAEVLNDQPEIDFFYSDEDKIDRLGNRCDPHFKPDFAPDFMLSTNYICHLAVIRKSLGDRVGWLRQGFEGSQDYDFFLRLYEQNPHIYHLPYVLYHWRKVPGSTAAVYSEKGYADKAAKRALEEYVIRNNIPGTVEQGLFPGAFRIKRDVIEPPHVTVVIPFRDEVKVLQTCLKSVFSKTIYPHFDVLLVNNNSKEQETLEFLRTVQDRNSRITVLEDNRPFNYSALNNRAVGHASGEWILFLNNDTEVIEEGWLTAMAEHLQRPEVGAVGARLLYPDNTVQHAGVILNLKGLAGHAHRHLPDSLSGYFLRSAVIQNFSACTAACLLVKKELFLDVGGFDEHNLPIAFNDIDLCLKIRQKEQLIVYTPYAKLYHYESKSRGSDQRPERVRQFQQEIDYFRNKWNEVLEHGDPYYNPNLDLQSEWFSFALESVRGN